MNGPEIDTKNSEKRPKANAAKVARASSAAASTAFRGARIALTAALSVLGAGLAATLRALGKFSITTWRLASALDSALWRAVKLLTRRFFDACLRGLELLGLVMRSLILWLPTRTGRAYSAVAGVFIVICLLWIADTLRGGVGDLAGGDQNRHPPIDRDDPILAVIGARYVHLSEVEAAAIAGGALSGDEKLTPESAFERGLVNAYVEQRLLARAARDNGLHRQPSVLRKANSARDRILAASLLQARIDEEITPETVARYYEEQRKIMQNGDEVRARHILVETGEEAEEIVRLLQAGADFRDLARERSLDRSTAPLGGEIGWFTRVMMARPLSNAAFATTVGDLAAPFQTEFGWHVLQVTGRRPTRAKPFSDLEDDIEEFLRNRVIADLLLELEDENRVIYYRPESDAPTPEPAPLVLPDETAESRAEASPREPAGG